MRGLLSHLSGLVSIGDAQREPRIIQEGMRIRDWDRNEEWEFRLHPCRFIADAHFWAVTTTARCTKRGPQCADALRLEATDVPKPARARGCRH